MTESSIDFCNSLGQYQGVISRTSSGVSLMNGDKYQSARNPDGDIMGFLGKKSGKGTHADRHGSIDTCSDM